MNDYGQRRKRENIQSSTEEKKKEVEFNLIKNVNIQFVDIVGMREYGMNHSESYKSNENQLLLQFYYVLSVKYICMYTCRDTKYV